MTEMQGVPPVQCVQPQQVPKGGEAVDPNIPLMLRPEAIAGIPPGLEYLTQVDQLLVKQRKELLEVFLNWEAQNKYRILNSVGQQVYYAKEESDCCDRQVCGPQRGFTLHITDNFDQEVMRVVREFKCCAGCCWCADTDCCAQELRVEDAQGQPLGYVKQRGSKWTPHYLVYNAEMTPFARVRGPCCICNAPCCGDVEFPVTDPDEQQQFGMIAKQWSGALKEYFTDADNFNVSFPMDLDVRCKATMIGALFLVDFMFFEKKQK